MLGKTVQHIDCAKSRPSPSKAASPFPTTRLCICTGSRPFVPPMEGLDTVENKTSFMTLDDAKHLNEMLGDKNDKRVLIVGAGLIGLKCAEGIYQRVSELTVIDLAPRILPNVLTEVPAAIIQKHIESKGVKFLLGDSVAQFEPAKAHLKSGGEIDFDILVVAVGVRPNTELAAEAGCEVNRGILIDEHIRDLRAEHLRRRRLHGFPRHRRRCGPHSRHPAERLYAGRNRRPQHGGPRLLVYQVHPDERFGLHGSAHDYRGFL